MMTGFQKFAVFAVLLFISSSSCKKDAPPAPAKPAFDKEEMLRNTGQNIIMEDYRILLKDLKEAKYNLVKFRDFKSITTYVRAKDAFEKSWKSWQHVAMYNFGPAAAVQLEDFMAPFPVDTVQVEFNIQKVSYDPADPENAFARGFAAIDYLLNMRGSMETMTSFYKTDSSSGIRIQFMEDNYDAMAQLVEDVLQRWSADGGNYLTTFAEESGPGIENLVKALGTSAENLETQKIGIPAGLTDGNSADPQKEESHYGEISLRLALESLRGLRQGFTGGQGLGLDDYLTHLNAMRNDMPLQEAVQGALDEAEEKLDAVPEPFADAIAQSPQKVVVAFQSIAKLRQLLLVDVARALDVE